MFRRFGFDCVISPRVHSDLLTGAFAEIFSPPLGFLEIFAEIFSPPLGNPGASPERCSGIAVKAEHCRSACTFPRQSGCAAFPRWSVCDALPPRDIEVVVESALSLVVVVSALWNRRFRCRFPPLRFGVFRHWSFVFCGASKRAALPSAWASSTVLMRCHSFVGGARRTGK